jgi:molybdopterin synthase sulfur carrier subunit
MNMSKNAIVNVKVKVFAGYREITKNKEVDIQVNGRTVKEAVDSLIATYPGLGPLIKDEKGIRPYVNVLLNGKVVDKEGGLVADVKNGDILSVFPPVAGG